MGSLINTVLSGVQAVKDALAKFSALTQGLLSVKQVQQIALDLVPRPIEAIVLNGAIYCSSAIAVTVAHVQPFIDEANALGAPLFNAFPTLSNVVQAAAAPLQMLADVKAFLDDAIAQKAGSAVLKAIPAIMARIQAFVTQETAALQAIQQSDLPTRAIAAHVEMVQVQDKWVPAQESSPAAPAIPPAAPEVQASDRAPDSTIQDGPGDPSAM